MATPYAVGTSGFKLQISVNIDGVNSKLKVSSSLQLQHAISIAVQVSTKHSSIKPAQRRPVVTCKHRPAVSCPLFPRSMEAYQGISGQPVTLVSPALVQEQLHIVPVPSLYIDADLDADVTVVQLSFGNRLGQLLDTTKALQDLGLNVAKGPATSAANSSTQVATFFITQSDNGSKVESAELIETIRSTILITLLKYHPEASSLLVLGRSTLSETSSVVRFLNSNTDGAITTKVSISESGSVPKRCLLTVETADRPGLSLEMVKLIREMEFDIETAKLHTEGLVAKASFFVSHSGAALSASQKQALKTSLTCLLTAA